MKTDVEKKGGAARVLKIIGLVVLSIIILAAIGLFMLSKRPAAPKNYTSTVKTGGEIEATYIAMGQHEVKNISMAGMHSFKQFEIWYPADMTEKTPVVIFVNGTGIKTSKYTAVLEHLASWGFITIGTEEEYAWNGFSAEMCYRLMERLDTQAEVDGWEENPFFGKIDFDNIGISGHSQGGVGVINAITDTQHADGYKAAFAASPANKELSHALMWDNDASKITIPILILSSTGDADENLVVNGAQVNEIYDDIIQSPMKVLARRNDANHGDMLYFSDGYMTAWFMWQLQGDMDAAKAFIGVAPELLENPLYQDQRIDGSK